ncbi:DUF6035 family protein [Polaribacter sp. M15]
MQSKRSIQFAFEKISGKVLNANEIFEEYKGGFKKRKEFNENKLELSCCECKQELEISSSKKDFLHFKHKKKSNPCIFKNSKFTDEENNELQEHYSNRESERHKNLKNEIGKKLDLIKTVDSIYIDNKFIIENGEKRKPDVYCEYNGKKIVFEIQLSKLSLRYILNRHNFYKRNGIFLIWILDNFDVNGQTQMEKDIKYLNKFENFFKLDEKTEVFRLICKHKYATLNNHNKILTPWTEKSISLSQLKFSDSYQVYFYDLKLKIKQKEKEQKEVAKELKILARKKKEEKRKNEEIKKLHNAKLKVKEIVDELRNNWIKKTIVYHNVAKSIKDLEEFELTLLNNIINKSKIHQWIFKAKNEHFYFIHFMLDCHYIEFDVNEKFENKTILEYLFENVLLENKLLLFKLIIQRNYIFETKDEIHIKNLNLKQKEVNQIILLSQLSNKLYNKHSIINLFNNPTVFCILESAKKNKIVGLGYKENQWISLTDMAINSYSQHFEIINKAFKEYGMWNIINSFDKNKTIAKKLEDYKIKKPKQDGKLHWTIKAIYPELIEDEYF